MYCKVTWFLHNLRWRVCTLFQRKKELQAEFMCIVPNWNGFIIWQVKSVLMELLCIAIQWFLVFLWYDCLGLTVTGLNSHFSVTQKIICSWSTAAVLFSWKVSIASCTPVSACCNGTVDLPPATPEQVLAAPSQRELEWLSNRSVLRQVISDRRNQPHFSAFPIALGFWRNKESSWKK